MEEQNINIPTEIERFCIKTLQLPETKENPAMVLAIAELLKIVSPL